MKLYIIRHLETEFNKKGLLQGRRDTTILSPSAKTHEQVGRNKSLLPKINVFDHILVSRLQRTVMTAALYLDARCTVEPLMDELDFGSYEGRRKEALREEQEMWLKDPASLILGEPLLELERRVSHFLDKYKGANTVLAFGHGAWIRALLTYVEDNNIDKMNRKKIANNEIIIINYPVVGRKM